MAAITLAPIQHSLKRSASEACASWHGSLKSHSKTPSISSTADSSQGPNYSLSIIEIEKRIREKVKLQYVDLLQAFHTYDTEKTQNVTRGEFRRVLELFCLPLTTGQFNNIMEKIAVNRNGTVRYVDFLNKFQGSTATLPPPPLPPRPSPKDVFSEDINHAPQSCRIVRGSSPNLLSAVLASSRSAPGDGHVPNQGLSIEQLVSKLRERAMVGGKPRNLIKALRLFDYNRDNKIQRHELRKVLDNYCFQTTDSQFEKLWNMFDITNSGLINYVEFLNFLGISSDTKPNSAFKRQMTQLSVSSVSSSEKNMDQLEVEFRRKVRHSFDVLQKTFLAFDPTRSGLIFIDDLRSVLHQFVMPFTDETFKDIMARCGFKLKGKIAWLTFLQKFQDPQGLTNGQTIPIKFSHKANPIQGADQVATLDELLILLYDHIIKSYSSLREAFLQLDTKRRGKISRNDLKKIFNGFKFHISDDQYKELMLHLDADQTGDISYHRFLHLFEEKESLEGHKWLKSVHRYNSDHRPGKLATETVESLIQEKLTKSWGDLVAALKQMDPEGTGRVKVDKMRKLIEKLCVCHIDPGHYSSLLSRLQMYNADTSSLNYLELLHLLGIEGSPGDVDGVAEQICQGNDNHVQNRVIDHNNRMHGMDINARDKTGMMTIGEIITQLKDRFAQHSVNMRDAFKKCDNKGQGGITQKAFRKVMAQYGLHFSDQQFAHLAVQLGFYKNTRMSYPHFLVALETVGRPSSEMAPSFLPLTNHKVNPIRGDEGITSAEELEKVIRVKIRDNFSNLREAFHKFDEENEGLLDKVAFRRLVDHFVTTTNDEEFNKLCESLNITEKAAITYQQFKDRFEVRETSEGHKWLKSDHRYNSLRATPSLTAEQVVSLLPLKCHQHNQDVSRAFCRTDPQGQGYITKKIFRQLLDKLMLQVEPEEFKKIWVFYDPAGRNAITWPAFIRRLGMGEAFTSGDGGGTSTSIIQGSHQTVSDHLKDQHDRHQKITVHQATLGTHLTDHKILVAVRSRVKDDFPGTQTAFKYYDSGKKGFLDFDDLRKLLNDLHLFLNDQQFMKLAYSLGISGPTDYLSYEKFSLAMEDPASGPTVALSSGGSSGKVDTASTLSSTASSVAKATQHQVEAKLRQIVASQADILQKALQSFDKENKGHIKLINFRNVLNNFCFKMSDSQFEQIIAKCQTPEEGCIDYKNFLDVFKSSTGSQGCNDWLESIQKRNKERIPMPLTIEQVGEKIKDSVTGRMHLFKKAFQDLDSDNIGAVSKSEFREYVLDQLVMRLTDEQFERLWNNYLPVNEHNGLDYSTFLTQFNDPCPQTDEIGAPESVPHDDTSDDLVSEISKSTVAKPSSAIFQNKIATVQDAAMSTPERQLRECMTKSWNRIFTQCKEIDIGPKLGYISIPEFLDIVVQVGGPSLLPCDLVPLIARYSLQSNGHFQYQNFIKGLLLVSPTNKVETKVDVIRKLKNAGIPTSDDIVVGMLRIRGQIIASWKSLRKLFRSEDPASSGLIPAGKWRKTLEKSGMPLSEEEFYQLAVNFDSDKMGKIDYNAFLKAFLKTT